MFRTLTLCLSLFISAFLVAEPTVRFSKDLLDNPKKHAKEIEKLFKIQITKKVNPAYLKNTTALENGYSKFEIPNAEPWYQAKEGDQVMEVSLVISKYPKDFNFWQHN